MPPDGHEPFLAMVLDNPSDDGPRLVYADWLEEHGDPRGEFIRVQVELTYLPEADPKRPRLVEREAQLLLTYGEEWRADVPLWARSGCEFRRGFITEVQIFTPWKRHFGPELSRAAPVEKVTLHTVRDCIDDFAAGPELRHVTELAILDADMTFTDLTTLCDSAPALTPLHALLFMGMRIPDAGAIRIANCRHLAGLQRLELKRWAFEHGAVEHLARSPNLPSLKWLDLSDNDLGNVSIWHLTELPLMTHLTRLHWNDNQLTNHGCRLLAQATSTGRLAHLELAGNQIGDAGARMLMERFPNLAYLDLARNPLIIGTMSDLKRHYGDRIHLGLPGE